MMYFTVSIAKRSKIKETAKSNSNKDGSDQEESDDDDNLPPKERLEKAVQKCASSKLQSLDMSAYSFQEWPVEWMGTKIEDTLAHIDGLDLSFNEFALLPTQVNAFKNLTELNLSANKFTTFPFGLVKLTNLEDLALNGNAIADLPPEIVRIRYALRWSLFTVGRFKLTDVCVDVYFLFLAFV